MKLTHEQLAEWKALVHKLNNDADDHMGVAHSTDMPPQHTVNFRHAKNAHEAAWAITNLITDLEEVKSRFNECVGGFKRDLQKKLVDQLRKNNRLTAELTATRKQLEDSKKQVISWSEERRRSSISEAFAKELSSELISTRKQLAEAQARNSVLSNAIGFAKRALDLQLARPPSTVMIAEYQIEVMKEAGRVVRAALCVEPTDALDAAIAEAVEPYRKQLAEAQARNAQVLSVAEKMRCAGGAQEFQHWFDELKLFLLRKPDTSALDAAIAAKGGRE